MIGEEEREEEQLAEEEAEAAAEADELGEADQLGREVEDVEYELAAEELDEEDEESTYSEE